MNEQAAGHWIEQLADDVGRLRRGIPPGSSLRHAVDRMSCALETLHLILSPSAGELVGSCAPLCPDATEEALRIVDGRVRALRVRMGAS